MNNRNKKFIAPIIIGIIGGLYYVGLFIVILCFGLFTEAPKLIILIGIVPLVILGILLYVTISRIKEIESGEEDDLSKY